MAKLMVVLVERSEYLVDVAEGDGDWAAVAKAVQQHQDFPTRPIISVLTIPVPD